MAERIKKMLDRSLEILVMVAFGILVIDVLWQVFTRFMPFIKPSKASIGSQS